MAGDNGVDNQFIFREIEFEDEKFHAASFVAKYRRVTSLESLRDQLRLYCDALKQQLYGIINRDYKDFITIATKLDGVDVRAEHLRKPLVDLRLDLAALHDGMVSSMQTIEDKLRQREEVVTKRRVLEATLACMEKLDIAEEIILNVHQQDLAVTPVLEDPLLAGDAVRGTGLRRRALLKSFNKSKGISAYASLSRDVFDCSELERAAHAAAHAQRSLSALSLSTTGSTGASMNQRLLEQRLHKLVDQLVQRIRARLSAIFSSAVSASTNVKIPDDPAAESSVPENNFPSRAFSHCLRALVALSKGQVAEEVVAETVTCPLAKPLLTQGRVDGNGGRGSYLGLKSALEALASQVTAALAMPLIVCAETFPATTLKGHDGIGASSSGNGNENGSASSTNAPVPIDLIVNGVWLPVAALLKEKFSGMFSVGIAGTLARCYTALEAFVLILKESEVAADSSGGIRDISSHPAIKTFHGYWKLDLYLQLRTQEISGRLDRVCHLVGQHGLVTKVIEDVYPNSASDAPLPSKVTSGTEQTSLSGTAVAVPHPPPLSLTLTLSLPELQALRATDLPPAKQLHLSLSEAFCIEIATCLHPSVALRALSSRFFALSMRLVMRLEAHAAIAAEVPTPSFSKSSLALLMQHQGAVPTMTPSSMSTSTPVKTLATPNSTPSTVPQNHGTAAASIDDLVLLALDLDALSDWLLSSFGPLAARALGVSLVLLEGADKTPLQLCLEQQQQCLTGTRVAVWGRVCSMLGGECKKGLSAVRAVAAKYRMTNKPAPDAPSPYVQLILQPFKTFLDRNKTLPPSFVATVDGSRWEVGVLEDVTAGYLMQVQALMETVKQMDSALERRSKLRAAAPVSTNMADSDKIAQQLFLDVRAYSEVVRALTPTGGFIPSYEALLAEVAPAEKLSPFGSSPQLSVES